MTATEKAPLKDTYRMLTDQVLEYLQQPDLGKFALPWNAGAGGRPVNAHTKLPYRGINVVMLGIAEAKNGFETGEWATHPKWKEMGAQVKQGEHGTKVVYYDFGDDRKIAGSNDIEDSDDAGDSDRPAGRFGRRVLAKAYTVFNAAQVDGYTPKPVPLLSEDAKIRGADEFFESQDVRVKHMGASGDPVKKRLMAFYSPTSDEIVLPEFKLFKSPLQYYAVMAHEQAHATGHPSRLNRGFEGRFGDKAYAMEELTAEMASGFVCKDLGLIPVARKETAQYIKTWIQLLTDDPRALFTAASQAQKAADYMHDNHTIRFMPEENYDQIGIHRRGGEFKRAAYAPGP